MLNYCRFASLWPIKTNLLYVMHLNPSTLEIETLQGQTCRHFISSRITKVNFLNIRMTKQTEQQLE